MRPDDLRDILRAECESGTADISVLLCEVGQVPLFAFEPDKPMVSASVIKVPVMLTALERMRQGKLHWMDEIPVEDILEDSVPFEAGPRRATIEELITWMIVLSDNTSTNALIDLLGMDDINGYIEHMGLRHTVLRRKMLDFAAIEQGRNNFTSASDMFRCFSAIYRRELLDDALCEKALDILSRNRDSREFRRYIWEDVRIAHKTGGLDHLSHDAGLMLFSDRAVYLGVFIQNAPDIAGDERRIGRIAHAVFAHYR